MMMAAALLSVVMACNENNKPNNTSIDMNGKENVKEVAGRRNFGAQHPVMTPQPCIMIATYDEDQVPDVMMAAWGGQCDYNKITFELGAHKTTENIKRKKAFTVSFATEDDMAESDYFGLVSGNKVPDKVKRAGFTVTPAPMWMHQSSTNTSSRWSAVRLKLTKMPMAAHAWSARW